MPPPSPDPRTAAPARHVALAMAAALLLVLWLHLLGALLAGLAAFVLYRRLRRSLGRAPEHVSAIAALVLTVLVLAIIGAAIVHALDTLWRPHGGLGGLLRLLADTLDRVRETLPPWIADRLPQSADDMRLGAGEWLRSHAHNVQIWGQAALRETAHVLVGTFIGLMCAVNRRRLDGSPWIEAAAASLRRLAAALAGIATAQGRIAVVNTVLTGLFLVVALPMAGVHMPLARTLVVLTFLTGLVPIVGNLVSNTAIVLVALTVSPVIGLTALVFLLVVHKLEYFLNAHFVGRSTDVPAAALLASMLVLEAAFGVGGLLAAPVYCAWLFRELKDQGFIGQD